MSEPQALSHLNQAGQVHMVDITEKAVTVRRAVAETWVQMSGQAIDALQTGNGPKGDVLATVRIAAIMATKKCADLIPLCHPLALEKVECHVEVLPQEGRVRIEVSVSTSGKTGVEMEALTGVSLAALTLIDMLKSVDQGMIIGPTQLVSKVGGKRGPYYREG